MSTLVIHTGGTIGMVQTATGFAPATGVVEAALDTLPVRSGLTVQTLDPLIDSANASPADWDRIAAIIAARHDEFDNFVITHGTDTLAYTAAALCFALEGLGKPVILTGAMLPLTVEGSDGTRNLTDALAAAETAPPGVWVQFAGRLLHGARIRKSHSRDFDAFKADPSKVPPRQDGKALVRHSYDAPRVAVLAVAPGVPDDFFEHAADCYDGLVLRCYGSGTAPATPGLARALQSAMLRHVPVIGVSQCPEGGIALGTYAAGAVLRENGVKDGRDMTVEAAYAKLCHVLSGRFVPAERTRRLHESLCGEFTPEVP